MGVGGGWGVFEHFFFFFFFFNRVNVAGRWVEGVARI